MKRFIAIILTSALLILCAAGCAQDPEENTGKLNIVCTIFPQYDWARQIIGEQLLSGRADDYEITLLLDSRIDLHNFMPSVDDIVKISTADLFIYVGGESDEWVEDALEQAVNKDMIIINLLEELGDAAKEEELLEGMEDDDDHGHDDGDDDDDHGHDDGDDDDDAHDDEIEYDEHVWLSLRNAKLYCIIIADKLAELDAGNAETYQSNLAAYLQKLADLDADYNEAVTAASLNTLLFADRFPFRYLIDDYGLTPYAAFSGCSAETEASFETIVFLAGKIDELNLNNVLVTESSDQSMAKTVISNTRDKNQQILVLDAMQSVSSGDLQNGVTYLSIMESNLRALKEALQ